MTRNQKDDTSAYPELTQALAAQQADDFIIDGEIVAFDHSQTSFARLQQRLGVRHPGPDLLAQVPVRYYVFDVLWADGRDVRPLPLRERKQILRDLLAFTDPLRFTEHRDTGELRHPRFQGLRDDKDPADVVREIPQASPG